MNRESGSGLLLVVIVVVGGLFYSQGPRSTNGAAGKPAATLAPTAPADEHGDDCSRDASELLIDLLATAGFESGEASSSDGEPAPPGRLRSQPATTASLGGASLSDIPTALLGSPVLIDPSVRSETPDVVSAQELRLQRIQQLVERDRLRVEFLIATVPDPVDSHVGWEFDGQLSAIQRAIENDGYVPDRHWLPWRCGNGDEAKETADNHRQQPGLLLFRFRDRVLVLFLVGETPTTGIHKEAFLHALRFVDDWTARTDAKAQPFRVIGPSFSGSAFSLREAIWQWWDGSCQREHGEQTACDFEIVSGAASGQWVPRILLKAPRFGCAGTIFYRTTVIPEDARDAALRRYLASLRGSTDPPPLAILTESGTAFGLKAFVPGGRGGQLPPSENGAPGDGYCYPSGDTTAKNLLSAIFGSDAGPKRNPWDIELPFPLQISRVRSAYARLNRDSKPEEPLEVGGERRPEIELALDDDHPAQDVIPSMAPPLTAAGDELALSQMLSTIASEGYEYVGIRATDTRDTLFLARQIRKYAPGVQLVLFTSDILFTHPDYDSALEGTLVLSSYPLFSANELWTQPGQTRPGWQPTKRLLFSSERAQGVFNASIATLLRLPGHKDDGVRPIEYTVPSWASRASTPRPDDETTPPLWISAIGRGGFWPLRYFEVAGANPGQEEVSEDVLHTAGLVYAHATDTAEKPDSPAKAGDVIPVAATNSPNGRPAIGIDAHDGRATSQSEAAHTTRTAPDKRTMGAIGFSDGIYLLFCLLSVAQVIVCCFVRWFGRAGDSPDLSALFWLSPCRRCRLGQHALVLGSFSVLFAIDAAFLPLYRASWSSGWQIMLTYLALATLGLVGCGIIAELVSLWRDPVDRVGKDPLPCCHDPAQAGGHERWWDAYCRIALVGSAILGVWVLMKLGSFLPWDQFDIFAARARNFGSGVSPLMVTVLLGTGLYLAAIAHLRRLMIIAQGSSRVAFEGASDVDAVGIADEVRRLRMTALNPLRGLSAPWLVIVALALWLIPGLGLASRMLPTFEGLQADRFLQAIFLFYIASVLLTFVQLVGLWTEMRQLLCRLSAHPIFEAFGRLPSQARSGGGRLSSRLAGPADKDVAAAQWRTLSTEYETQSIEPLLREGLRKVGASVDGLNLDPGSNGERLGAVLEAVWSAGPLPEAVAGGTDAARDAGEHRDTLPVYRTWNVGNTLGRWLRLAEEHVALQIAFFLNQQLVQLRYLLGFVTVAILLFLLAIDAYPFQPHGLLSLYAIVVFASTIVATVAILVQIEKDPVLSRIAGTAPNKLDRSIIVPIVTYAIIPLLGLLAAQFPEVSGVASGAERVLRVLH